MIVRCQWTTITGIELTQFSEDAADADIEGLLLAANAQGNARGEKMLCLANGFLDGFQSGLAYNLKNPLTEFVLS